MTAIIITVIVVGLLSLSYALAIYLRGVDNRNLVLYVKFF